MVLKKCMLCMILCLMAIFTTGCTIESSALSRNSDTESLVEIQPTIAVNNLTGNWKHGTGKIDEILDIDGTIWFPQNTSFSRYELSPFMFDETAIIFAVIANQEAIWKDKQIDTTNEQYYESSEGGALFIGEGRIAYLADANAVHYNTIFSNINETYQNGQAVVSQEQRSSELPFMSKSDAEAVAQEFISSLQLPQQPYVVSTYALATDEMIALDQLLRSDAWFHYMNDHSYTTWPDTMKGAYRIDVLFLQDGLPMQSSISPLTGKSIWSIADELTEAHILLNDQGILALELEGAFSLKPIGDLTEILSVDDAIQSLQLLFNDFILTQSYSIREMYLTYLPKRDANYQLMLQPSWCFDLSVSFLDPVTQEVIEDETLLVIDAITGKEFL